MMNAVHHGDCLEVLPLLAEQSVDLCYLDPPFMKDRNFDMGKGGFDDSWRENDATRAEVDAVGAASPTLGRVLTTARLAYGAKRNMDGYLAFITLRLMAVKRVLRSNWSLYLHCDDTAAHYLKVVCDQLFGAAAFKNDICWKRNASNKPASRRWPRQHDRILFYSTDGATFMPEHTPYDPRYVKKTYRLDDDDGLGPYALVSMASTFGVNEKGRFDYKGYPPPAKGWNCTPERMAEYEAKGLLHMPVDADGNPDHSKRLTRKHYLSDGKGPLVPDLWTDIKRNHAGAKDGTGWPTQKPIALLERIIKASSIEGDTVLDPFCGSGTTLHVASTLGRRYVGCDVSVDAVTVARKRME